MTDERDSHVLVVDDDADVAEALGMMLDWKGYSFEIASDGAEALERLRSGPLPRVILLDMMMPGMDGEEFRTEQLRDPQLAEVPVVLLTGDARASEKAAAMGVYRFLRKPVNLDDLLDALGPPTSSLRAPYK